ncbi:hypothetical protein ACNCWW_000641 [Shigella sonnei]
MSKIVLKQRAIKKNELNITLRKGLRAYWVYGNPADVLCAYGCIESCGYIEHVERITNVDGDYGFVALLNTDGMYTIGDVMRDTREYVKETRNYHVNESGEVEDRYGRVMSIDDWCLYIDYQEKVRELYSDDKDRRKECYRAFENDVNVREVFKRDGLVYGQEKEKKGMNVITWGLIAVGVLFLLAQI